MARRVNMVKINSYGAYWFVREQPVQITGQVNDANLYLNEKIAVVSIISTLVGDEVNAENEQCLLNFAEHLLYHLKYRSFDAQTIELMIEGFVFGQKFQDMNKL